MYDPVIAPAGLILGTFQVSSFPRSPPPAGLTLLGPVPVEPGGSNEVKMPPGVRRKP